MPVQGRVGGGRQKEEEEKRLQDSDNNDGKTDGRGVMMMMMMMIYVCVRVRNVCVICFFLLAQLDLTQEPAVGETF